MPITPESGNLQLTGEEMTLYRPAADLVLHALYEEIDLRKPLTGMQFTALAAAHAIVTRDNGMLEELIEIIENEIASRKRPN